jgi:hypothetical protein
VPTAAVIPHRFDWIEPELLELKTPFLGLRAARAIGA